jgi:hypothetical protein
MVRDERRPGGLNGWVVVALLVGVGVVFNSLGEVTAQLGGAAIPIWFMTIGGAALVLRGPLGKAIARRLSGELPPAGTAAELPEELYAELDELRARLGELEERQDFSERLLARRDEPPAAG